MVQPQSDAGALAARAEIKDVERQLAEFTEQAISGTVSAAAFAKIEAGLLDRIERLRPLTVVLPPKRRFLRHKLNDWNALSVVEQRSLVRDALRVVVMPVPRGKRATLDDVKVTPL